MMICSVSWAEWQRVGNAGDYVTYVDKLTIRINGKIRKMWTLNDFSSLQTISTGKKYKSEKALNVFDCNSESYDLISIIHYSDSMGNGNVISNTTYQEKDRIWDPVPPGTMVEELLKIACAKK